MKPAKVPADNNCILLLFPFEYLNLCLQNFRWPQGAYLSFQCFKHDYHRWKNITYRCIENKICIPPFCVSFLCPDLSVIKHFANHEIHSLVKSHRECTIMLLSSLANPEWISIPCSTPLLHFTICVKTRGNYHLDFQNGIISDNKEQYGCGNFQILKAETCYTFIWKENISLKDSKRLYKSLRKDAIAFQDLQLFQIIFDAISPSQFIPKIIYFTNSSKLKIMSFALHNNRISFKYASIMSKQVAGHFVYKHNKNILMLESLTFHCDTGEYISFNYVCNRHSDCLNDNSDEIYCLCLQKVTKDNDTRCNSLELENGKIVCANTHQKSLDGSCQPFTHSFHYLSMNKVSFGQNRLSHIDNNLPQPPFICNNGLLIHISLFNDLISDCGPDGEDEPLLKLLLSTSYINISICKHNEIPCRDGHSKCFNISDICIFKLNTFNHLTPCRNGANIQNCRQFQCNLMYKCQESYCIAWSYLCDGKIDCPYGDDEHSNLGCGYRTNCINMYKCSGNTIICIPLGSICNNLDDCPKSDDETFCQLKDVECPFQCQCVLFGMACKNINYIFSFDIDSLTFLSIYITMSPIFDNLAIYRIFKRSKVLKLPNNKIRHVCFLSFVTEVLYFDLSGNFIRNIEKNCFLSFVNLVSLKLSSNDIFQLYSKSFFNLYSLKFLDMSNNPLTIIPNYSFLNLLSITVVNFTSDFYKQVALNSFSNIKLPVVVINTNYISEITSHGSLCMLYPPSEALCSGILSDEFPIQIIFLMLVLTGTSNTVAIVLQLLRNTVIKSFLAIAISINTGGFLFGLYFGLILIAHLLLYKTLFVSRLWKTHNFCFLAFGLILWYSFLYPFLLTFMAVSRFMVVFYPLKTKFKQFHFTALTILVISGFSFGSSLSICLIINLMGEVIPSVLCFPFVEPTDSGFIMGIVTWFVGATQILCSITILIVHILVFMKVGKSKNLVSSKNSKSSNPIIIQIFLLTVSSIVCWFPSNIIYITAIYKSSFSVHILIWTTILITPINSIVQPLALSITSLKRISNLKSKSRSR